MPIDNDTVKVLAAVFLFIVVMLIYDFIDKSEGEDDGDGI